MLPSESAMPYYESHSAHHQDRSYILNQINMLKILSNATLQTLKYLKIYTVISESNQTI